MITSGQYTSVLVPSQLPAFVREDPNYQVFVAFLQAYYEWMEQNGNVTDASKNILNYMDIDTTTDQFMQYFINDFLPYLPQTALISPTLAIKTARQLYQSKGTPASYKFLFRILYNSDFDYLDTEDFVLKPSDGDWYIARSVNLYTNDSNFLNISNLRLFGQTSKTLATIQNSVRNGEKTEVFIDDIEREFQNGELVYVVDSYNQPVYFYQGKVVSANTPGAETLSALIVGQINQINIKPNFRGSLYQVGDPVVVYGGLNPNVANPVGATAEVASTTTGYITGISVVDGGYGYSTTNTTINITNAPGAAAFVAAINPSANGIANVTFFSTETIGPKANILIGASSYGFANSPSAHVTSSLANALTFLTTTTYPISFVALSSGGGGTSLPPTVSAITQFVDDYGNTSFLTLPSGDNVYAPVPSSANNVASLSSVGILAPIQIANTGHGYLANDTIVIAGGRGYGAYANITSLSGSGGITGISYVNGPKIYPLGGMGYTEESMPTITVRTSTGSNASLYVPGILGGSAVLAANTQRIGSVTTISITNAGEDYIETPNVSLNVLDVVVSNLASTLLPSAGDFVYQGISANTPITSASVASITPLVYYSNPLNTIYNLRLYNYGNTSSIPASVNGPIHVKGKNIVMNMAAYQYDSNYSTDGVRIYGDGLAQATASFLNGLVVSQGQYINYSGQPSGYSVLESQDFNAYTYQITVDQTISVYRDIILNLLHPSGMKLLGRYAMGSSNNFYSMLSEESQQGTTLSYLTNSVTSNVVMISSYANPSNNIIKFNNLNGANLQNIVFVGNTIALTTTSGDCVTGVVTSVSNSNTVTISSNVWLSYANVAYVYGGSFTIQGDLLTETGSEDLLPESGTEDLMTGPSLNISALTNSYNLVNGGIYTNPLIPLEDIIRVNDNVFIGNNISNLSGNTANVVSVDYVNNIFYIDVPIDGANGVTNTFVSVNRTYTALGSEVIIYGTEVA